MRKLFFILLLAALSISPLMAQDEPIRVGLMTDASGALAIYGTELENGFKLGLLYAAGIDPTEYESIDAALAELTVAGRPLEVLVRDNGSVVDTAQSQARELIEQEGVELLVGAPNSGVTQGLQQVAIDSDVILFAAPGASPDITGRTFNENTFRVCRNSAQDALALASFALEGLGKDWVILAADYEFGRASAAAFERALAAFGVTFVQETIYAPLETTDFTPYLQQVLDSGADVVLPIWAGATSVPLFQQINELGVQDQMTVVGAFNSNDIVRVSDPSTINTVSWIVYHYTFPQTEINTWLTEKHIAIYSDVPDLFTECGFATAQALYMTLTETNGDTLPTAMIPVLEGMVFEGPKGTYAIRPSDHQALVPMYVARLVNLDDPDQRYYELLAELPFYQMVPPVLLEGDFATRVELDTEFNAMIVEMAAASMMMMETPEVTPEP